MGSFMELFTESMFKKTIQKYCTEIGWNIADLNDRRAILKFDMESGRTQTLYIIKYETTLEFSVPSGLTFNSEDDVPHRMSTLLLQRSSGRKIGFWCIEKISKKYTYSCMHNADIQLINVKYFASVVRALISECDEFEGTVLSLM